MPSDTQSLARPNGLLAKPRTLYKSVRALLGREMLATGLRGQGRLREQTLDTDWLDPTLLGHLAAA